MEKNTFVNQTDKQHLLYLITEIRRVMDNYPWFCEELPHVITTVNRVKSLSNELERQIQILPVGEI